MAVTFSARRHCELAKQSSPLLFSGLLRKLANDDKRAEQSSN
jgi:hypothetical protein